MGKLLYPSKKEKTADVSQTSFSAVTFDKAHNESGFGLRLFELRSRYIKFADGMCIKIWRDRDKNFLVVEVYYLDDFTPDTTRFMECNVDFNGKVLYTEDFGMRFNFHSPLWGNYVVAPGGVTASILDLKGFEESSHNLFPFIADTNPIIMRYQLLMDEILKL